MKNKYTHLVNTQTRVWYHQDELNRLWTCDCLDPHDKKISLCITIDELLEKQGELREVERSIAVKRKELGLLMSNK